MHRTRSSPAHSCSAVRAAELSPQHVLLPADRRERREPGPDAPHRRAVSSYSVLWEPEDGRRARRESQAYATTDAENGNRSDLPEAAYDLARRGAQDLPVFTAECGGDSAESSMGQRH